MTIRHTHHRLTLLAFSLSSVCFAGSAGAENKEEPIVVVGNWLDNADNSDTLLNHGGARTIKTKKQIDESGAQTVADALRGIPGVQVRDSNGTGGSDVSLNVGIRGLPARLSPRSTILLDGIPLAAAPYGQPQLSMSPLSLGSISSIDVMRGATSVRYGPQNVGGVINFVTKPIPATFGGSASVKTQGARTGGLKTLTDASVGGSKEDGSAGALLLYSGLHGQGYRKNNDNTDIDDIILKTRYTLSETDELLANFHYYHAQSGMPGGLTDAQYKADPYQSVRSFDRFEGNRQDMSFKYRHQEDDKQFELLTWFSKSYRGSYIESEGKDKNAGNSRLISYPRHYTAYAIEPNYSQLFRFDNQSHEITFGYRYLNETADEKAYRSGWYQTGSQGSRPDTGDYYQHTSGGTEAHAIYIDDTINAGNWTIIPGLRYENINIHLDDGFRNQYRSKSYSEPLPALSVIYHIDEQWKIFANTGSSFGSLQYFQLNTGGAGNDPANGLSAEKAHNYEVGTRFDDGLLSAEATVFYIDFNDQLQYIENSTGWTNLGATTHQGIELAINYDLSEMAPALDGASIYSTYTYTKAVSKRGNFADKDLPFYSRQVFTAGTRYETGNWVWNLNTYAQSKQQSPGTGKDYLTEGSADGRYGIIPGYMMWDARTEYHFGPQWSDLTLSAGVKNLFDQASFTRSTDNNYGIYAGQPRTFFAQASVTF